ncbi:MAG: hypothetical protein R6U19_03055 [Bacteroidales bacterium]
MKKKFAYYISGLFTGILLGGGLAWLIYSGLRPPEQFSTERTEFLKDSKNQTTEQSIPEKEQSNTQTTDTSTYNTASIDSSSSTSDTLSAPADTLLTPDNPDSTALAEKNTLPPEDTVFTENEQIIVRKDKLLAAKSYHIHSGKEKDTEQDKKNIDSLLIDDKYSKNGSRDSLLVEFWKSPINYKGYRRIKNRLILFGISRDDSIKIYQNKDGLFFRFKGKDFPLNETNEFRSIWFEY